MLNEMSTIATGDVGLLSRQRDGVMVQAENTVALQWLYFYSIS